MTDDEIDAAMSELPAEPVRLFNLGFQAGMEAAAKVCDAEADANIPGAKCSAVDRMHYGIAASCAAAIREAAKSTQAPHE